VTVGVLDAAIPARDVKTVMLTDDAVGREPRELIEQFPGSKDTAVASRDQECRLARAALKDGANAASRTRPHRRNSTRRRSHVLNIASSNVCRGPGSLENRRTVVAVQSG
jgi:hypothetical protein